MTKADNIEVPREEAWSPWSPDELYERIGSSDLIWAVVGGWALDLWHGRQTRTHEDLEFTVLQKQADECRLLLAGLRFYNVRDGVLKYQSDEAPIESDIWQLWGCDQDVWRVDMMIERGDENTWVYKRDPSLRMPRLAAVKRNASGIPYLAPHLVLLFKAKHLRDKDQQDFDEALPKLTDRERADLLNLVQIHQPGHIWINALSSSLHC